MKRILLEQVSNLFMDENTCFHGDFIAEMGRESERSNGEAVWLLQAGTALREQGRSKPASPSVPQLRKGRVEGPFGEGFKGACQRNPAS